jgi:hypothetical protein
MSTSRNRNSNSDKHNKNSFNHDKDEQLFFTGAERDMEKLLTPNRKGKYFDSRNARPTSKSETSGAIERIDGENKIYFANTDSEYEAIASFEVLGKVIEVWASSNPAKDSRITVNGIIVLESPDFPVTYDNHLQFDTNNNCIGGEFYITDYKVPPMYFNVADLVNSVGTEVYFDDFNIDVHNINFETVPETPVLVGLENAGAGGGLPVGQHAYSFRYVSETGEKSNMSVRTPLIYVPNIKVDAETNSFYPYIKNQGGDSSPESPTPYGVHIKIRIDNKFDYDYIEIIRLSYAAGEGLGFVPQLNVVKRINVSDDDFFILHYTDGAASADEAIPINVEDEVDNLSVIKRARAIRYFKKRMYLMNVEFESRDVDDLVEYTMDGADVSFFPVVENIGSRGLDDPMVHALKRPLMNGEAYGWAAVFYDGTFSKSFASRIEGFQSYRMPNRRDNISSWNPKSLTNSVGPCFAADVDNTVDFVFDCVDHRSNVSKQYDPTQTKNVMNIDESQRGYGDADDIGFEPFKPVSSEDILDDYDFKINPEVNTGSDWIENNAHIFRPQYISLGMCLEGIESYPSWAKSVQIVRTKKANKVICQGLGFWNITEQGGNGGKSQEKLMFNSPDILNGVIDPAIVQDMKVNPSNYEIQLVAPYGFSTEVYHWNRGEGLDEDTQIDLVTYIRVQCEQDTGGANNFGRCNNGEPATDVGIPHGGNAGYVGFGRWRNPDGNFHATVGNDGNTVLPMVSFVEETDNENVVNFILETDYIYDRFSTTGEDFEDADVKDFQEPVYIVNIVQLGKEVPSSDYVEFYPTEAYIKFNSIIGYGNSNPAQEFEIAGERTEDFFSELGNWVPDKYIYIDDNANGIYGKWIDITQKLVYQPTQIPIILDDILNGTTLYNGEILKGVYVCTEDTITFNHVSGTPTIGAIIEIRYDKRFPIKVFGGDSVVGQHTNCLYNKKSPSGGNNGSGGSNTQDQLQWKIGLPYRQFRLHPGYYVPRKINGVGNNIANTTDINMDYLRQFMSVYDVQSFTHCPLAYTEFFPNVNYIIRPQIWDSGIKPQDQQRKMFEEYDETYPEEYNRWRYGGFRFHSTPMNLDFSKTNNKDIFFRRPAIGFEEQTLFCTRIVSTLERNISKQNFSNLKSFKSFNYLDLGDRNGAIMHAFSGKSSFGDNVYALCKNDIAVVLIDKKTLSQASGEALATVGGDGIKNLSQYVWLNETRFRALQGETWLSFAEKGNVCFFVNKNSVFRFEDNKLEDIGKLGYEAKIYDNITSKLKGNYKLTSVYETKFDELWILFEQAKNDYIVPGPLDEEFILEYSIPVNGYFYNVEINVATISHPILINFSDLLIGDKVYLTLNTNSVNMILIVNSVVLINYDPMANGNYCIRYDHDTDAFIYELIDSVPDSSLMYVWSEDLKSWISSYDFRFDKMVSFDNKTFGSKNMETYQLHYGNQINNQDILFEVENVSAPENDFDKEFKKFKVFSSFRPQTIEFFNDEIVKQSELTSTQLKDYGGFEQFIPVNPTLRNRVQGMFLFYKINDSSGNKIKINKTTIQYKNLN